jgi:hypothetical protein
LLFSLTGAAGAATIGGTVAVPEGKSLEGARVVATDANFNVVRADVNEDGTFELDVEPGTFTVALVARGLSAPAAKDVVVAADQDVTQNLTAVEAAPFCIVKSASPIPLTEDIDSAAFADAPVIQLNSGENVAVGEPSEWGPLGGPNMVSGRFKLKYSDQALHLAADVTYKTPLVNIQTDGNLWNGNALEFDFQNDPYDFEREAYDPAHNWQLVVGLGETQDWWLHGSIQARPEASIAANMRRVPKEDGTGEKFRLDIPWGIFRQGDATGDPISAPADNALGAIDIVMDAADPEADRTEAVRRFQLTWSGFDGTWTNPSQLRPVQFCPQPPAAGQ